MSTTVPREHDVSQARFWTLALLVTVLLLKSPVRTGQRIEADRPVTAAADAEVAGAIEANAPAAGDTGDGNWMRKWEWHHRARLAMLFVAVVSVPNAPTTPFLFVLVTRTEPRSG